MKSKTYSIKIMRIRLFLNLLVSLLLILSSANISIAQGIDPMFRKIRLEVNRKARPNTSLLPPVSKVELLEVGRLTVDGEMASIKSSKLIEGLPARRIASIWRSQSWDHKYRADCHVPAYAIKFYAGDKLILYTSICWKCSDVEFLGPGPLGAQGFNAKNRKGRALLRIFKEAFPQ
jgi:hypothetical protein